MDRTLTITLLFSLFTFITIPSYGAQSIYDIKMASLKGKSIHIKKYSGDVLLVVNTASKCGYTPQLKDLQKLHSEYKAKGFQVLGFPSNDFNQEDLSGKKLKSFCLLNYGVDFPMFTKSHVTGDKKNSLYKILTPKEDVRWNFEKLLVSKTGKVIARYSSSTKPYDKKLIAALESALTK